MVSNNSCTVYEAYQFQAAWLEASKAAIVRRLAMSLAEKCM